MTTQSRYKYTRKYLSFTHLVRSANHAERKLVLQAQIFIGENIIWKMWAVSRQLRTGRRSLRTRGVSFLDSINPVVLRRRHVTMQLHLTVQCGRHARTIFFAVSTSKNQVRERGQQPNIGGFACPADTSFVLPNSTLDDIWV